MTGSNDKPGSGDALEDLLRRAPRRLQPPPGARDSVRQAVHAEWRTVVADRLRQRRRIAAGMAATFLVISASLVLLFRLPAPDPGQVATIESALGSVWLMNEQSELRTAGELTPFLSGQRLVTGPESGAALALIGGGSLRADANTRVDLLSKGALFLESGRIYFDADPAPLYLAAANDQLEVRTRMGTIAHRGTQYMVSVEDAVLSVTVREGVVEIASEGNVETVEAGERLILSADRRTRVSVSPHSDDWHWAEVIAPAIDLNRRPVGEFLAWAGRETGRSIRFTSDTARRLAGSGELVGLGKFRGGPVAALQTVLPVAGLTARIEEDLIVVSEQ